LFEFKSESDADDDNKQIGVRPRENRNYVDKFSERAQKPTVWKNEENFGKTR
jgi:hypothetical protein